MSGRMTFYGKSHTLIQMTIFYLSWIMLYGINQVPYTPEMNPIKSVKKFENEVLKIRLSKHWKLLLISFKKLFKDSKKVS